MLNATELMQTNEAVEEVLGEIDLEVVEELVEELVDGYGFQMYGDMGDTFIVLNVKGKPEITLDIIDKFEDIGKEEDLNRYIEARVEIFANQLSKEDRDFAILGRSGGYWGYDICDYRYLLTLSKQGIDLVEKMLEEYVQELIDNGETDDEDIFYNRIEGDVTFTQIDYNEVLLRCEYDIVEELIKDTDNFRIEMSYIDKMNKLKHRIFEEEQSIERGLLSLLEDIQNF